MSSNIKRVKRDRFADIKTSSSPQAFKSSGPGIRDGFLRRARECLSSVSGTAAVSEATSQLGGISRSERGSIQAGRAVFNDTRRMDAGL